jgi:hypothetical protein
VINAPQIAMPAPRQPVIDKPRIVQARKPGSKPYLSLNMPKAPPDKDADPKVKALFKKMIPNPSHATG